MAGEWLASSWRVAGVQRLTSGWRAAGERLASGWRAAGERLASSLQAAGERLASGWRAACERLASGLRAAGNGYNWHGWQAAGVPRLTSGWRAAADGRLASGLRAACKRLAPVPSCKLQRRRGLRAEGPWRTSLLRQASSRSSLLMSSFASARPSLPTLTHMYTFGLSRGYYEYACMH